MRRTSEFPSSVHQRRQGAQRSGLAAQDAPSERADRKPGLRGLCDLLRLEAALRPGQERRRFQRESRLDRTAEGPSLLVFIEADRKLSLRGALQRSGVARQGKHLRDAAAPRLLRRRGGNLLPALELFLQRFFVRPRDAARAREADQLRRAQVDTLSPLEALNLLYELKSRLG